MRKIILEMEYFIYNIYQMLNFFKRIASFIPRWSYDLYFALKIQKSTGLLILNSLKHKKLIFTFLVNRNWNNLTKSSFSLDLTDSRKRAKL